MNSRGRSHGLQINICRFAYLIMRGLVGMPDGLRGYARFKICLTVPLSFWILLCSIINA
jgi:hypothetical protein